MSVVPSEVRHGIPSELLYADDLVIMAPIMEPLVRRVTEWTEGECRKVMVGISVGNIIVNSGK